MTEPAVIIREYQPADQPAAEDCLAELQDFSKLIDEYVADGSVAPRYLQYLLTRCSETNGQIFVAEGDDGIVGMVCVFARVEAVAVDKEPHDYAYVSDLVVLASQRGKGLGRLLLKRAEDYAQSQGARLLSIHVLAQNAVARGLYLDYGFAEVMVALQKNL